MLNSVQHGVEKLEVVIDSGAAENVAPPTVGKGFAIVESAGSKRGQQYITADGSRIPNLGQKAIIAETAEGNLFTLGFQMANVTKPLASVGRMCDAGNSVVFGPRGGYIQNMQTGQVTEFKRLNGVYLLEAWAQGDYSASGSGFTRQGC